MARPQQANISVKRNEKVTKYRQLAFELREGRPGYNITIVPVVITLHNVCAVPWGDILSTVGGYLEYRGGYLEYRGGIS